MGKIKAMHVLLIWAGLMLPAVVQAEPEPERLRSTMTVQWCPAQQQIHLVLLFGYDLEAAKRPGAPEAERWPLGYQGVLTLAAFGAGGACTKKTCPDHVVFDRAIRPPAWKIQHSLATSSLPEEVTFSIPALEDDPSFGPDSLWHFQLQASDVPSEGCRSIRVVQSPAVSHVPPREP
ncbi:MAG: hypothetical protein P8R54_29180 [Myxococcota bacterium]|nr:hypothetical protein [Myxococcota bacterium]